MSLFPRAFQEISPLFQLIDDYDRANRAITRETFSKSRTFHPKFDVKELKDSYELHGELPGIEQKDINIEWTDGNTLTISGRTETHYEKGTPPRGQIEGEVKENSHEYHEPSVENEDEQSTNKPAETALTTTEKADEVSKPTQEAKYWVAERTVGEFHRSFSFPTRVDQDAVKASLKNGILSIAVPKAKNPQPRKVNIE